MVEGIKPLNVSPFIKTVRWSFLLLGILYGIQRKYRLQLYEMKASVIRNKEIAEAHRLREKLNYRATLVLDYLCPSFSCKTEPSFSTENYILTGRWGFLIAGIIYGIVHQRRFTKIETKRLLELERTRPEREARKAAEKAKRDEENMEVLRQNLGDSFK